MGSPLAQAATILSLMAGRTVVDRTGLTGRYDVELSFAPTRLPAAPSALDGAAAPADQDGPSLFAALQEQLGLKLEPDRDDVEVLVVDRVQPPTED